MKLVSGLGAGGRIGTYHVGVVFVEVNARLLPALPLLRYRGIYVGLVNDLGDQLWSVLEQVRAWGGDLGAVDGICRRVLEQQRDEGAEGIEEEADDQEIDHQEDEGSTPHRV